MFFIVLLDPKSRSLCVWVRKNMFAFSSLTTLDWFLDAQILGHVGVYAQWDDAGLANKGKQLHCLFLLTAGVLQCTRLATVLLA